MAKSKSPSASLQTISAKKSSNEVQKKEFLIVGMGASAGGLETLEEFFKAMPKDPGMAFVIVQHLDPTHKSLMVQLLKKHTEMTVLEVKDNTQVIPNHVYMIPPNKDMAIFNGVLHLMDPTAARGFRKPIDFFFRSLAEDQTEKAVGIILSGTGTEGTLSLKDIKGHGGLALVQDPETAKYDGMPKSAIKAGVQDFILPVNQMPEMLLKYAKNRMFKLEAIPTKESSARELLEKVFILLRNATGCNFSDYKSSTIIRRIEKRMALNQIDKLETYIKYLQKNKNEVLKLFNELLIGVSSFFRDEEAFLEIENSVIPKILRNKEDGEVIRVWVAGCSTGEEAYSLAILFDKAILEHKKDLKVQIFASDLDEKAIMFARQGVYPNSIAGDIRIKNLSQYFHSDTNTYRIKRKIRDQIVFAEHNLIKDPPFSKLDMVSCRNLLIYLNLEAQKKVFTIFNYALNPDGILFLGTSESLGEFDKHFEELDRKHKIFRHKNVTSEKVSDIGHLFKDPFPKKDISVPVLKRVRHESMASMTEKMLLATYAPACAIINHKGDAVYFFGNTGKYLQPSPGEARLNIVDMAREGLKSELQSIISKFLKSKTPEVHQNIEVKTNGFIQVIDLKLRPLEQLGTVEDFIMVTFEEKSQITSSSKDFKKTEPEDTSEIIALGQELSATKEYLRSTIEQLELSNEELKSSNEELQSSNEELQSANEEMETSKEELQSVNEEIVTVNTELQEKINELALAYDDMSNLLASTEIGTIFLNSQLQIKRFTPSMSRIINLISSDVGRPFDHLSSNLIYNGILEDIQMVLAKLTPIKKSVKSLDNIWYLMQIMPYRTSENVIEGVVITFVDITSEKLLAEELKMVNENYAHLLEMTGTVVYTQDLKLNYTSIANIHPDLQINIMLGKSDKDFFSKEDAAKLDKLKNRVLKTGKATRETISLKLGGHLRLFDLMVRPILENGKINGIACTSIDLTNILTSEKELAELKNDNNGE
ncbi:PAS domain-containing protein [Flavobacteriaceae bacterium KMM 6898]|nr:PAS domain-containing protein [Flavobacteriaceae bacterium KMM 6898]